MTISIRQIHPVFVGEVEGVDLRRPLSAEEVEAIEAGMDRYSVLVFHDQSLSDEQQVAFSRNFSQFAPRSWSPSAESWSCSSSPWAAT